MVAFLESVAKTGMILLAGEITSVHTIDYQRVVRDTIKEIGYDDSSKGANKLRTANVRYKKTRAWSTRGGNICIPGSTGRRNIVDVSK